MTPDLPYTFTLPLTMGEGIAIVLFLIFGTVVYRFGIVMFVGTYDAIRAFFGHFLILLGGYIVVTMIGILFLSTTELLFPGTIDAHLTIKPTMSEIPTVP